MTVNRSTVRKQFASRLASALSSIVEKVYDYQAADFKGASPVVIVTSQNSQRASSVIANDGYIILEVHTFVLYALSPVQVEEDVESGTGIIIPLSDTSFFVPDQVITIEDDTNTEDATVVVIDPDVSITIAELANAYTAPRLRVWTESMSEDQIDQIEYEVAQEITAANDDDTWLYVEPNGETVIDVVEIGGEGYRHEMIPVKICIEDF